MPVRSRARCVMAAVGLALGTLCLVVPMLITSPTRMPLARGRGGTSASPLTRPADPAALVAPVVRRTQETVARAAPRPRTRTLIRRRQAVTALAAAPQAAKPWWRFAAVAAKPTEGPDTR